jgi:hypothetical protein
MNTRARFLPTAFAAAILLVVGPARAALFDFDARSALDLQVTLSRPALADRGAKLAPGVYDVHVTTSADGSVHADFFQQGVKRGEARGIIAVRKAGGERTHTFQSLGFSRTSPSTFRPEGQKLSFEVGAPGSNQILIGLLLPAVQPK